MTTETMVRILHAICPECGSKATKGRRFASGDYYVRFPVEMPISAAKEFAAEPNHCWVPETGCGRIVQFLYATEPVRELSRE